MNSKAPQQCGAFFEASRSNAFGAARQNAARYNIYFRRKNSYVQEQGVFMNVSRSSLIVPLLGASI
jgi:hypothetical protein